VSCKAADTETVAADTAFAVAAGIAFVADTAAVAVAVDTAFVAAGIAFVADTEAAAAP